MDQQDEHGEQGELYRGFGDSLSRSFELAITPPIIAGLGYLLDRWLGIVPVLTIVFFLTAMIGLIATMWFGYDARMKDHEQSGPWATGVHDSLTQDSLTQDSLTQDSMAQDSMAQDSMAQDSMVQDS